MNEDPPGHSPVAGVQGPGDAAVSDDLHGVLAAAVPRACSAAVALIAVNGEVVAAEAVGEMVRYAGASGAMLPRRPPVTRDAIFDLASITKLFTTVVILSLADEGRLDLDEPINAWSPATPAITPRHLLTHTSGLPASCRAHEHLPGDRPGIHADRMALILATPLLHPPGERHLYSDVGLIIAGRVAEIAGGAPLDELVRARITTPLGLVDTGYRPSLSLRPRIVATEFKPAGTGCVRGEVHDETAHGLGGVAGHAGIFSTADDLLRFAEALRTGGAQILRPATTSEMTRPHPAPGLVGYAQGLGVRLSDPAIAAPLLGSASPPPYGHSGFTGTSLVIDPARGLTIILLTNNVHPLRGRPGIRELRHAVASTALKAYHRAGR